jgi:hypothetical protein
MASGFSGIDDATAQFIRAQRMFFVASAPLARDGHVNLSPKGLDSFRVVSSTRVAYADFTGSGVETIAHLRENARLTIMFCSFEGPPRILRLWGTGRAIETRDGEFAAIAGLFPVEPPLRAVIVMDVTRVAKSCGFGVPMYEYKGERTQLQEWCAKKGEAGIAAYQREKNARSLDGLPGLRF